MAIKKYYDYAHDTFLEFDPEQPLYFYEDRFNFSKVSPYKMFTLNAVPYELLKLKTTDGKYVSVKFTNDTYRPDIRIFVDEFDVTGDVTYGNPITYEHILITKTSISILEYYSSSRPHDIQFQYNVEGWEEFDYNRDTSHYYKGIFRYNYVDKAAREMIEDVKLFKFPNATIIGEPTINNGQISNFSTTSYLKFPFLVDFKNRPFEIQMELTTGSNVTNQENIFDSDFGLAFAIRSGKFVIAVSSNGTNWNIGEGVGTYTVLPNTNYKVKLGWSGTQYTLSYSVDGGNTWNTDITKNSSESPFPKQIYIGVGQSDVTVLNHFSGIINLNYANLYISDSLVWQGMDDVGLASRLATDMSNIDEEGKNKIKEIAETGTELTLEEYKTLPEEEQNNGTYYITDANLDGEVPGTAGTIKPYVYSEEETIVGVYDGKPLYRKCYHTTIVPLVNYDWTNTDIPIGDTFYENIVSLRGHITVDDKLYPCSYYYNSGKGIKLSLLKDNIRFTCNEETMIGKVATAIIEYTKTTDAEGSGNNLMPYGYVGGDSMINYSTEEQVVGKWIDGKPIYQKTYHYHSDSAWSTVNIKVDDIPYRSFWLLDDFCFVCDTGKFDSEIIPLKSNNFSGTHVVNFNTTTKNVGCSFSYNAWNDFIFTIQYLKTTD